MFCLMPKVVSYFTFSFLLFKFLVTFLLSFVQKLRKMRTHLTLTYFLSPSFSKIIFIAFISFHFAPCFTQDTLHEFKACGVKNYYNGRALANIFYPKIGRRPKLDSTIGMNSLEYNFLKINQSDHRVAIMKEDHFDHFSALNKIDSKSGLPYQRPKHLCLVRLSPRRHKLGELQISLRLKTGKTGENQLCF